MSRMSTRARVIVTIAVVIAVGGGAALYWFQPWRLFTNSTVQETLPSAAPSSSLGTSAAPSPQPPQNVLLATGTLISHEHESRGSVRLIRLADGRTQLTLEGLATSDGPDLHVWLTDQPVRPGRDGWFVFDDGRYIELGPLKANNGDQVYDVPAGTDLTGIISVTIWCKRFSVSFGAAPLNPA
jgi:hypothetical protein